MIDRSAEAAADPDDLLTVDHVRAFEAEHGPLPEGGWLLLRTGWDARAQDEADFLNAPDGQPHTPGPDAECARWLAEESPIVGFGVETVGTDAGAARRVRPAVPRAPLPARRRQVRHHAARQPGRAAADRGACSSWRRCVSSAGPAARAACWPSSPARRGSTARGGLRLDAG